MRLKSLILSGFKSFPKRTVLNFSKGVSAIVGPNGSGKSNIVDAIRWVLGEQNPRLLRAGKMDELIYSGSPGIAVDCARVKLRLEECQDMAPPELRDFSDIDIERVLYRDGGTRFLLNGKNCRLKEIRYLFLDTGTGPRAYSIIDQGRVGQFVTMTPEERRLIVEEVAGISRYRERRLQAQGKMNAAKENLDRLEDVISEVRRQRNALKRQAKKAERFTELRNREERLGLLILKSRMEALLDRQESLERDREDKMGKRAGIKAKMASLEVEIARLDMELERLFDSRKGIRQKAAAIEQEKGDLFRTVSSAEKELALLRQEQDSLRQAIKGLKDQVNGLKVAMSRTAEAMERDAELLKDVELKVSAREREAQEQAKALSALKARREEIKDKFVVTASMRAEIFERLSSARKRREQLEERIERMEDKRRGLREHRKNLEAETRSVRAEMDGAAKVLSEKKGAAARKAEGLSRLQERLRDLGQEKEKCSAQISIKETRLCALQGIEAQGEGLLEGNRALLETIGNEAALVADMVEVADGFEDLVETALGITLQCLVFKSGTRLRKVMEMILHDKDRYSPASLLFCHESFTEKEVPDLHGSCYSGLEALGDKVAGMDPVARKIRCLLASWVIVEDMHSFLSFSQRCLEDDKAVFVISRDGFILTPWKEVRHLLPGSRHDSGIISRKKQIRKLTEELGRLQKRRSCIIQREGELLGEEREMSSALNTLEAEADRIEEKIVQLKRCLSELESRAQGIGDRIELLEYESDEARSELNDIVPMLQRFKDELERAKEKESKLHDRLKGVEKRLYKRETEAAKVSMEKNRLLIRKQELISGLRSAKAELSRLEQGLARTTHSLNEKKNKIKELYQREEFLSETVAENRKELAAQKALSMNILSEAAELDEAIDRAREKRFLLDKDKAGLQKGLSRINRQINEAEMGLSETERNREHIFEVCASRFRRDMKEIIADQAFPSCGDVSKLEDELRDVSGRIESFGPVNLMAMEEFKSLDERLSFLLGEKNDILKSMDDLEGAINRIDRECRQKFKSAMKVVNSSLEKIFPLLFEGGRAWLSVVDEKNMLESGVDYRLRLPGRKIGSLSLLSGGEKALCAFALIFAIFLVKPTPFCLLDEVDAPLDEANTGKFNSLVRKISSSSQVIVVTHNQRVMETADALYGVTMEDKGVSKLVSVKLV